MLVVQQVIPLLEAADFQVAIRNMNLDRAAAEASASRRDLTRYIVYTKQGEAFSNLPKRHLVYQVVKEAIGLGLTPQEIARAVPWRESNMFIFAPGNLSGDQLMDASSGKDRDRYFCNDDEVFHLGGKTYAMSKDWGRRTEEAVQKILKVLPLDYGIRYEAMP